LEEDVLVGRGCRIGENSLVSSAILGQDCHIGNNVTIR
jgi:UDP-3-O-[3-hydroxymyristoyl] glucosamine N-acyltransferase